MTVLRLAAGSAGWLPAGWSAGSGGAAFIRSAVTVFCTAKLSASATSTAPRSEASRWPTAAPTRTAGRARHDQHAPQDQREHRPLAPQGAVGIAPHFDGLAAPYAQPERQRRAHHEQREIGGHPPGRGRQAADPEEGQDQRGQHQQPRLDPRHLTCRASTQATAAPISRTSATVLAFMTPPGTVAAGARRGRHDSSSVRDCRVSAGEGTGGRPFPAWLPADAAERPAG
jgi:hypothetical protein